jgi:hypothetical protein
VKLPRLKPPELNRRNLVLLAIVLVVGLVFLAKGAQVFDATLRYDSPIEAADEQPRHLQSVSRLPYEIERSQKLLPSLFRGYKKSD